MRFALLFLLSCSQNIPGPMVQYKIVEPPRESNIVAKIGALKITKNELYKNIELELFELEEKIFKLKMDRLKILMLEKFMDEHPGKKGLSKDQFLEKYITKNIKITEKEFNAFVKKKGNSRGAHLRRYKISDL